jgi:hypothetical protein
MTTQGATDIDLTVDIGGHEGTLASVEELRDELTQALWLGSRKISVTAAGKCEGARVALSLVLEPTYPVVLVVYHGETPRWRETLRAVVERELPPESPDPRRHWRWVAPIVGCCWAATIYLIGSRIPLSLGAPHLSRAVKIGLFAFAQLADVWAGAYWAWLAFRLWLPSLERLPDTAVSLWDRRRAWVQVGVSLWVTIVLALLTVHAAS